MSALKKLCVEHFDKVKCFSDCPEDCPWLAKFVDRIPYGEGSCPLTSYECIQEDPCECPVVIEQVSLIIDREGRN